jgi:hypothetical protein
MRQGCKGVPNCGREITAQNTGTMECLIRPMFFEGPRNGVRLISQRGHLAHKSREIGMKNHDQKAVVGSERMSRGYARGWSKADPHRRDF